MGHTSIEEQSLVTTFLVDLAYANHSPYTCRAYAADLARLCAFHQGSIHTITAEVLRTFFERHAHLRPATRARKQAAVARFPTWTEQQELLEANPMRKIDRVKLDPPQPRGVECSQIERILKAIPASQMRDRLFVERRTNQSTEEEGVPCSCSVAKGGEYAHGIILGIRHLPGLYWPRTRTCCVFSAS